MPRGKAKSAPAAKPSEQLGQTVPRDLYDELIRKLDAATLEVETYRAKSPLVGVRWFGEGGFGTKL